MASSVFGAVFFFEKNFRKRRKKGLDFLFTHDIVLEIKDSGRHEAAVGDAEAFRPPDSTQNHFTNAS